MELSPGPRETTACRGMGSWGPERRAGMGHAGPEAARVSEFPGS